MSLGTLPKTHFRNFEIVFLSFKRMKLHIFTLLYRWIMDMANSSQLMINYPEMGQG